MADPSVRAADFDYTVSQRRDPFLGTVLDGYRIDEKLAEGGFGAVYVAKHVPTGERVALKVLHPHLARDPNMTARFQREATTMSRLHSPHTVATRATGEAADGTLYIAMELLRGESLHDRLARGPLPWKQVIAIARAICASLAEAHALGVVHRDLKPANIHLTEGTDAVKVLDFGIVEVRGSRIDDGEDLTRAGMTVGTLDYMSPEQVTERPCDGRSDLYSLGVLMYEAVTGTRPFPGLGGPQLLAAMLTQVPERPSTRADVPPELDRAILTCLRRDPRERHADVRALDAALAAIVTSCAAPSMPRPLPRAVLATLEPQAEGDDDEATTWCTPPQPRPIGILTPVTIVAKPHAIHEAREPGTLMASSPPPPKAVTPPPVMVVPPAPMAHPAMLPVAAGVVAMPALPRAARGSVAQMREEAAAAMWAASQMPMLPQRPSARTIPFDHVGRQRRDHAVARMAVLAAISVSAAVVAVISHLL